VAETSTTPNPQAELDKLRELAQGDLYVFAKGVLGFDWLVPEIHQPLCRLLELYNGWSTTLAHPRTTYEQVLRDKHVRPVQTDEQIEKLLTVGLKRLGVLLHRTWLKTTLCSIAYPVWRAVREPNFRALLAQNTFKNACSKNKVTKALFEKCSLLQALWPTLMPTSQCSWSAESLCVNRTKPWAESTFEAAGTRTQVTSRHYDLVLEDDTVAPDKDDLGEDALMPSKDDVAQAIGWHQLVPPLLLNVLESQNLIVATRWYVEDLIAWSLKKEKGFVWYMRACREDVLGNPDPHGEVQYHQRFNDEVLADLADRMGPYLFSCLYLNTPLNSDNMTFRPEWIQWCEQWPRAMVFFTSVDPAGISARADSDTDYNTVVTCGKDLVTGRIYVVDYYHERMSGTDTKGSPGDLIQAIFDHVRRWAPVKVKIETVAYQATLAYYVRERMRKDSLYFMVEDCPHPRGSKEARIRSLQPMFASGAILMRSYMQAMANELLAFPFGKHDDLIDALAMQLDMWTATPVAAKPHEYSYDEDPMSVDAAAKSLRDSRRQRRSQVMDVCDIREELIFN